MKKLLYAFGGLVGLVVVAIVVIPLVYDVNTKVRPKIVEAIESNMNAKTEIGKLGLSLWGGVFITIDSFRLLDLSGEPVFEMKDAKLAIPFSTILGGNLSVSLIVDKPVLHVTKNKQGVLNVSNLMKPKAAGTENNAAAKSEGSSEGSAKNAGRISFSTEIRDAIINYKDMVTGQKATVDRLTLITKNVTVNKPFSVMLVAGLDYSKPPEITVKGDLKVEGDIEAKITDAGFDSVSLKSKIVLDGLAVKYGALFNKEAGVPFGFATDLTASSSRMDMKSVEAVLNDFKVNISGSVENFSNPVLDIKIASNKLDLSAWRPVLASAKDFEMDGNIGFDMNLKGALEQLVYSGSLSMKGLGMKLPGIVPRATDLNGEVSIENNLVRLEKTSMKLGTSDMSFAGTVRDFSAPNIQVSVNSRLLDLDQLMPSKPKGEGKEKEVQPTVAVSEKEQDAKMEAMAKGPIDSIKKNPMMRKMVFKSTTKISKLVVSKAELTDFAAQVDFENLVLSLSNASMKAFNGAIQSKMSVDFKGVEPSYAISGNVKDLEIDEAVVSQMPEMKDFISGRTFANLSLKGSGVAPSRVKANLKGSGNFEIKNGKWSGFSPLKVIGEKLSSIPGAKDKLGGVNVGNKFRQLKSQFEINDSKIFLKDTVAELEEAKTTITAEGYIGFDKNMKVTGNILAPVSNPPPKINNGDGRAKIPYEVAGSVSSPSTNWGATLGPVGQAYLEEEGKKVLKKGLEKVQESLQDGKIKDLLKGINF